MVIQSGLNHFRYHECGQGSKADRMQTFCRGCQLLLLADYQLQGVARNVTRARIATRPRGLWRWSGLLPVFQCGGRWTRELAQLKGILTAPEGAATLAALVKRGWVKPEGQIVLFNAVTGLKYITG